MGDKTSPDNNLSKCDNFGLSSLYPSFFFFFFFFSRFYSKNFLLSIELLILILHHCKICKLTLSDNLVFSYYECVVLFDGFEQVLLQQYHYSRKGELAFNLHNLPLYILLYSSVHITIKIRTMP